jgi:hypothetical protein
MEVAIGHLVSINVGAIAVALRIQKQEAWLMDIREEFARLIEQKRREVQEAQDLITRTQVRLREMQTGLPTLEAALEVLNNGFLGHSQETEAQVTRPNPCAPGTMDSTVWEILSHAGEALPITEIMLAAARALRRNVPRSSVDNVFYTSKHSREFIKVVPGVFRLARDEECRA